MARRLALVLAGLLVASGFLIDDLDAIARIAKARGVLLAVDNTFTTPRAVRPFEHGANIVIHSVTKLLAGHSDATLGYVAAQMRRVPRRHEIVDRGRQQPCPVHVPSPRGLRHAAPRTTPPPLRPAPSDFSDRLLGRKPGEDDENDTV